MFYYKLENHFNFLLYSLLSLGFSLLLLGISYLVVDNKSYFEKGTSYECGFDPFSDTRNPFEIKFYVVAILFILFDIEILFFIPWVISLKYLSLGGFYIMVLFVFILIIGFFYEYKKGALD